MLFDSQGKVENTYAWGLGISMRNQEEALSLWLGLKQAERISISNLIVVCDSIVMIRHLSLKMNPKDLILS